MANNIVEGRQVYCKEPSLGYRTIADSHRSVVKGIVNQGTDTKVMNSKDNPVVSSFSLEPFTSLRLLASSEIWAKVPPHIKVRKFFRKT